MAEQAIRDRIRTSSRWRVARQLGRGQYGTAYLVDWSGEPSEAGTPGDQAVAKVVGLEFLPEKEQAMAFQEVELLRDLKHPGIVGLRDHFMTEANLELVIVMEFCDGGDLRGEVKRRTQTKPADHIPEAQIMMWFVQLTLALNYMHGRHILHRDLKSSNIFLITNANEGRDVKIGDFGISRVLEGTVDVAATVVGTPYYMSPEVCKAEAYGFKSDVWALGCVLYEMCMLKHAFESQSLLGLVYKIVSETYDPIPPQYSSDLRTLIDRVLDKSHYTRPCGKELMADPYVRRFVQAAKAPGGEGRSQGPSQQSPPPRVSLAASIKSSQLGRGIHAAAAAASPEHMRACEPSPAPPCTAARSPSPGPREDRTPFQEEQPVRREWCAPPFVGATPANSRNVEDGEFRAKVYVNRIRRALAVRRQNWLQIFASFDHLGNGQLQESEFDRAVISMALGLSDAEIREVRAQLQGSGSCVPVYEFGKALHGVHPQVTQLEEWGRSVLSDLSREAARAEGSSNSVAVGATVRIFGLQSAAGMKLNGSEGVIESWDAAACRWVVRLTDGVLKSIRDENLEVLRPSAAAPPSAGAAPATTALYRLLCEGGETAVSEVKFLSVVERMMPKLDEAERRRLLLLLPKSPEGRVDVPEVLSQLVAGAGGAQQLRAAAPGMAAGPQPSPKITPAFDHGQPSPGTGAGRGSPFSSPAKVAQSSLLTPPRVPGSVPSPRARNPIQQVPGPPNMPGGGGSTSSTAQAGGTEGVRGDVAILRLAQRLAGRGAAPGPGLDALRLFAANGEDLRPEELAHAVSVLPLGISRAEVTSVFDYVRASSQGQNGGRAPASGALPFALLHTAVEAALSAGVPSEAATLERLNEKRLSPALQRLAASGTFVGRASPQDFRVTLMQAEPYLTHFQLEWLMMLTDKDGEGRLLPATLLTRLGWSENVAISPPRGARGQILVPPRPAISSRVPIAPHTPRSLVVAAALARVRDRLARAGPQVRLDRVLGLFFDMASLSTPGPAVGREVLATLLGHLRLGISATEADELVSSCVGARAGSGEDSQVPLASLFEKLQRAEEPEMEEPVEELREAAMNRLVGRGDALAGAAAALEAGDWLPEAEFRQCLSSAFADDPMPLAEEEEERLLLLAEKTAAGEALWRPFFVTYAGWKETDMHSYNGDATALQWRNSPRRHQPQAPQPCSPKRTLMQHQRFDRTDPGCSSQSWRSTKTGFRNAATPPQPAYEKSPAADKPKGGLCPCRRRCST